MPSPVSRSHGKRESLLINWLSSYERETPGCETVSNTTWFMQNDAPQPDVSLRILPEYGGQSSDEGPYCSGAPELVVEVCQSSATYDLGPKLALYQSAGVQEYITVLLLEQRVVWRVLREGRYTPLDSGNDRICRSEVFPGLWLDIDAAASGNTAGVYASLPQGLQAQEHAAFVRRLESQRR